MAKLFYEVFPTLKITGDMKQLLEEAHVTKVGSNAAKTSLRIYLESDRLIPKPEIYSVENAIKEQLFPKKEIAI